MRRVYEPAAEHVCRQQMTTHRAYHVAYCVAHRRVHYESDKVQDLLASRCWTGTGHEES